MIKKINVKQLKPGMYIHDINCGWIRHPFLKNSIRIKDDTTIGKIFEYGIREVYIDTDKGPDADGDLTKQQVAPGLQMELDNIADSKYSPDRSIPLEREIVRAREIRKEAKETVRDIMGEVRFGRPIKTEKVEKVVDKMVDSIFCNQDALITLGRIKRADEYTYMHSMSVCVLMISFGKYLGFNARQLKEIGIGAMLHDVGKMKVPEEILNNKGSLNDQEYELMKKHVEYSHLLLEETQGIAELSLTIACQHHERLDGKGYPNCLKGDDISIYGQAAAIADVYDAMTSKRCYQPRFEPTEVLKKLYEWDKLYNKDLVQQFIRCVGIYPVGSLVRLESGLLGIILHQGKENLLQPGVRIVYDTGKSKYIMPTYDIDLSKDVEDRISGYELPDKWSIKPEMYL
jgi:HD-GYP domain-containing protein (c-di-GMP phosphodiesterase class II)